jgi:hypothetical protein
MNKALVLYARQRKIENGRWMRTDTSSRTSTTRSTLRSSTTVSACSRLPEEGQDIGLDPVRSRARRRGARLTAEDRHRRSDDDEAPSPSPSDGHTRMSAAPIKSPNTVSRGDTSWDDLHAVLWSVALLCAVLLRFEFEIPST